MFTMSSQVADFDDVAVFSISPEQGCSDRLVATLGQHLGVFRQNGARKAVHQAIDCGVQLDT